MTSNDLEHCLDLRRTDLDLELFAAALAVQHIRRLIVAGGSRIERPDEEEVLNPRHLREFLARAVETAHRTRRFVQEWHQLKQLMPQIQAAWDLGQVLFEEDVVRATNNPEEMEYLVHIDFAESCYAEFVCYD